jgi:hypothetical protein
MQFYYFLKKYAPYDFLHIHSTPDTDLRSCNEVSENIGCNYTLKAHKINFTSVISEFLMFL